jgi:hypothetical protein
MLIKLNVYCFLIYIHIRSYSYIVALILNMTMVQTDLETKLRFGRKNMFEV